jgi:putative transposase
MSDPRRITGRAIETAMPAEATCAVVGYPKSIRVDQGSEFISRDLDL